MIDRSNGLDALRYIAACMVVFSHCFNEYQLYGFGGSFVDVFFVISGLVIARTTDKQFWLPAFLKNRILRIYPSYIIATFLMIIAMIATGRPIQVSDIIRSLILVPSFGVELYYPLLKVGWSLAYEMFFYITFGITLFFERFFNRSFSLIMILSLSVIISDIYVFEFWCGIVIYVISSKMVSSSTSSDLKANILQITGFIGILSGELLNVSGSSMAAPLIVMSSVVLVSGAYHSNYNIRLLVQLGRNTSYEIYLYHPLVINALAYALNYIGFSLRLPFFILVTIVVTQAMVWVRKKCVHLPGD